MQQQMQQQMNPFEGIMRLIEEMDASPDSALQKIRFLAKSGVRPPPFRDPDSLIKSVEEMFQNLSQVSQNNQAMSAKSMQGAPQSAAPIMPNPQQLGQFLTGGLNVPT
jgi:hypothetical protein